MISADPAMILDRDLRIIRHNPAFTELVGHGGRAVRGSPLRRYFVGVEEQNLKRLLLIARRKKTSLPLETDFLRPDGETGWIQWKIAPYPRRKRYYATGRDITRLKEQEEQLRISYTAMESAANGIYLLNRDETITWVNPSFTRISGFAREEIVGKKPEAMSSGLHSLDFFNEMKETLESGMVWKGDCVNQRPDGSLYHVEQTIAPILSPQGQLSHFVAVMQDISERKKAERILQDHCNQLNQDMDMAGKVQASLLPAVLPEIDGFDIEALSIPARYVSGDLYDCFVPVERNCILAMADISGKGVAAAMLASSLKTLLRTESHSSDSPARLLSGINRRLFHQLGNAEMFITIGAASIDPVTAALRYASAGHTQGIIVRGLDNSIELFPATGIPLGIMEEISLREIETFLAPGDSFVLYSDGITEARDSLWNLFGLERLIEILESPEEGGAGAIIRQIIDAVSAFRGETPLSDDLSLVVLCARPRTLGFSFEAALKNLEAMTAEVRTACAPYGQEFCYALELSASELLTNVVKHSHMDSGGTVRMTLSLEPDRVELDIYDTADFLFFITPPKTDTEEPKEGGYGLGLIHSLCDELTYAREEPKGNHWHIMKRRLT